MARAGEDGGSGGDGRSAEEGKAVVSRCTLEIEMETVFVNGLPLRTRERQTVKAAATYSCGGRCPHECPVDWSTQEPRGSAHHAHKVPSPGGAA